MSVAATRRVFYALSALRWFPIGLVVSITTLLPVERGLTTTQALSLATITGLTVFTLELPTSGFADTHGRKPVLMAGALAQIVSATLYCLAPTFLVFCAAALVNGVFRALDSGPLEAWFVDRVHETEPGADVSVPLSRSSAIIGASIAAGALLSSGLVRWHPIGALSALTMPYIVYIALAVVYAVCVVILMKEEPDKGTCDDAICADNLTDGTVKAAKPRTSTMNTIMDGLRLVRTDHVLLGLVGVEFFVSAAMVVFEALQPLRLAEFLGGEAAAGRFTGLIAALGWGTFCLGSVLVGLVAKRIGVAVSAIIGRVLNGLGAVWMGLTTGPVGLVAAYLFTYGMHGFNSPMYSTLLHRQAESGNRATIMSLASMIAFVSYAIASPSLGWFSDRLSIHIAMVLGGAFSVLGAICFIPALRAERFALNTQILHDE